MTQRWMLTLAVSAAFGLGAVVAEPLVGQTQPTTAPGATRRSTSGPTAVSIDQLIKQLGSDDATERDGAQQQLVGRGSEAIDALKKAAANDDDLEVRSRAAAALAQIGEHDALDVSTITLHIKDGQAQDVLNQVAAQAHAQFAGPAPGIPIGPMGKAVSIDADHRPFWDVMTDLCRQLDICPMLDLPSKNTMKLFPNARNWLLDAPHQIVGPYWVGVSGLNRTRFIDLQGPQRVDDQFTMTFIVYPEPKLAVTQISDFNLTEATDDAGNSLMPTGPAGARNGAIAAIGMAMVSRSSRQTLHTVQTRLAYPAHPGTKIATLRGNVVVTIAQGVQQLVVDDLLGTPALTNPIKHCQIHVTTTHNGPDLFQLTIECTRDGMLDEQWQAIANRLNDITVEDADGHPLTLSYVMTPAYSDTMFKSTALFTKSIFAAQQPLLNRQIVGRTGDAKRLTWNIATRLKTVTVPVKFSDLPMP